MVYLALTSMIWAFSFGLIGNTLAGLDPLQVASVRLGLAFFVFLPFLQGVASSGREKCQLMLIGALQYGVMYSCMLSAFKFLPSHLVALFTLTTPLYIVVLDGLKKRYFSWHYLLAAGLSVLGAAVIRLKSNEMADAWLGFFLIQLANLAFAIGQLSYRDWKLARPALQHSQVFGFMYLGAVLCTSLATLVISQRAPIPMDASLQQWLVLLYLGVVASGLGFFWWNKGATLTTTGVLAAFNNAVVPLAMFASLFVFAEAKAINTEDLMRLLLGSGLMLLALWFGRRRLGH